MEEAEQHHCRHHRVTNLNIHNISSQERGRQRDRETERERERERETETVGTASRCPKLTMSDAGHDHQSSCFLGYIAERKSWPLWMKRSIMAGAHSTSASTKKM